MHVQEKLVLKTKIVIDGLIIMIKSALVDRFYILDPSYTLS